MASIRDIQLRIKSIEGTEQITKAMKLVATAKLQKAKSKVETSRPHFEKVKETIGSIIASSDDLNIPILNNREVKKTTYIVISSDRGLAGGYNANICKMIANRITDKGNTNLITVGKKAKDFFIRRDYIIDEAYTGFSESPDFANASNLGNKVFKQYMDGETDEIFLAYTKFNSTINQEPILIKLFPIDIDDFKTDKEDMEAEIMNYEPDAESVLGRIIPKYVNSIIYGALVESAASEQGARMTAMDSATNNAIDMINDLTLLKNRARQDSITQELSEIVAGAEALK